MSRDNSRNESLDFAKIIASFFVVCIHSTFEGKEFIYPLLRLAVPFFFIISGYFYGRADNKENYCKQQIFRMFFLFIISNLTYFVVNLFLLDWKNDIYNVVQWIFTGKILRSIFFFNYSPFCESLWYVSAILYVWIVQRFLLRSGINMNIVVITLLLAVSLLLGKYYFIFRSTPFSILYSRNFLLTGLPFFEIGKLIYGKEEQFNICNISTKKKHGVLLALLVVYAYTEQRYLRNITGDIGGDIYCSSVLMAPIIVVLILENWNLRVGETVKRIVQLIGKNGPLYIFLCHSLIGGLIGENSPPFYVNRIEGTIFNAICIFLCSYVFVSVIHFIIRGVNTKG